MKEEEYRKYVLEYLHDNISSGFRMFPEWLLIKHGKQGHREQAQFVADILWDKGILSRSEVTKPCFHWPNGVYTYKIEEACTKAN